MELAEKLQLTPGQPVECNGAPQSFAERWAGDEAAGDGPQNAALFLFVANRTALENHRAQIVEAVSSDRLTWVMYPKAGQLATDLNRDSVAALLQESGIQPVRQVAIDGVWSALRFRPGSR